MNVDDPEGGPGPHPSPGAPAGPSTESPEAAAGHDVSSAGPGGSGEAPGPVGQPPVAEPADAALAEPVVAELASTGPALAEAPAVPEGALASPEEAALLRAQGDTQGLGHGLGVAARVLAVFALLGVAVVAWAHFTFDARWVTKFVVENALEMPARMRFIRWLGGGAGLGAAVALGLVVLAWRKRWPLTRVERWAWFLSPGILLPAIPILFRYKPWKDRHEALLPVVLVTAMVFEVLLTRAFGAIPGPLERATAWVRRKVPGIVRRHGALVTVLAATAGYIAFFAFYTLRWHYKLKTHNFDLSINNNLLFRALHGYHMQTTVAFPRDPTEYLAAHAKFGQYLFLPIYALFPRPETLLVIQSFLIGAGAIPLFLFARRRLPDGMAMALAVSYLCFYPMHSANFYEVQYPPMAAVFVLGTIWAVDARRWVWLTILFICAAIMREDIPIGLAVVGTFLLLSGHRPIPGLIMAVVASAWFVFLRFFVMDRAGEWWFPDMYKGLWAPGEKGLKSVIKTLITNPAFVLEKILIKEKIIYLMHLLVPLVFLPARRWWLWAAFIPGTILTLLVTNYNPVITYTFQYVMHWAPYCFVAAALGLAAIIREQGLPRARAAMGGILLASMVLTFNYGAFSRREGTIKGGFFAVSFEFSDEERERLLAVRELAAMIPADAKVAATENCGPHVSSRTVLYALRYGHFDADYVMASNKELGLDKTKDKFRAVVQGGKFGVLARRREFVLLKKGHERSGNGRLMADWKL